MAGPGRGYANELAKNMPLQRARHCDVIAAATFFAIAALPNRPQQAEPNYVRDSAATRTLNYSQQNG
jgi:hypothetical protein